MPLLHCLRCLPSASGRRRPRLSPVWLLDDDWLLQVAYDCEVINTSVMLMVLNFICHIVPLNTFLFNDASCLPVWCPMFLAAQAFGLVVIIKVKVARRIVVESEGACA